LEYIEFAVFPSSIGNIILVAKSGKLIKLDVTKENEYGIIKLLNTMYPEGQQSEKPFKKICLLLDRYLKREMVNFDVDLDISGEKLFTRRVLQVVKRIPYGETRSYGWIGKRLGYKSAARAVGQALKRNPIPIIIPCHRVIREDSSIGGFSLKGVSKEYLLTLERAMKK